MVRRELGSWGTYLHYIFPIQWGAKELLRVPQPSNRLYYYTTSWDCTCWRRCEAHWFQSAWSKRQLVWVWGNLSKVWPEGHCIVLWDTSNSILTICFIHYSPRSKIVQISKRWVSPWIWLPEIRFWNALDVCNFSADLLQLDVIWSWICRISDVQGLKDKTLCITLHHNGPMVLGSVLNCWGSIWHHHFSLESQVSF